MKGSYRISPCKNYRLLRKLHAEIFPDDEPDKLHNTWWIVRDSLGDPVGFCSLRESVQFNNCVFFTRAGVKPIARGAGLQKRMIRARLAWAKRHGYEWALTYTVMDNYESIANLIKCGFHIYQPKYPYVGKAMYFRKAL